MTFSKQWKKAAEIPTDANGRPKGSSSPMPVVIVFTAMILVAGIMRHVFHISGIVTLVAGLWPGLVSARFLSRHSWR